MPAISLPMAGTDVLARMRPAARVRSGTVAVPALAIVLFVPNVGARGVDEVVVTARKSEESLQDVPFSVAAFTDEQMRARGMRNNYDIANFTPNFNTVQRIGRAGDRPVIRGMTNPPDPSQAEANASYFIDGVFVASTIATATTAAMERVEVLRGPQSAKFGRATFSGAVNYVTRKPTNDFESEINTRVGTSEEWQLAGWMSGPIIRDNLHFLLSAAYDEYGGQWRSGRRTSADGRLFCAAGSAGTISTT